MKEETLAPIVLFTYNRPLHTEKCLSALANNDKASESILFIFSDGPKQLALPEDIKNISEVRKIIHNQKWPKELKIIESSYNKGLTNSIIEGITIVIKQFGKVIVLEDDLVTSKGFLKFMNQALTLYKDDDKVMQISGYIYGTPRKSINQNTHFLRILGCNGWATWERAWDFYQHDVNKHIIEISRSKKKIKKFDIEGHATWYKQLLLNQEQTISSWAVRWYASWWLKGGYNLFPKRSLLTNIGHDGSGIHPPAIFYNGNTVDYIPVSRIPIKENKSLRKEIDLIWKNGSQNITKQNIIIKNILVVKKSIKNVLHTIFIKILPELKVIQNDELRNILSSLKNTQVKNNVKLYKPYHIFNSKIGEYTYVSENSYIMNTEIKKFCSIGPNFKCGWGIHPTNSITTSPMFYSTMRQNGVSLSPSNKVQEHKTIIIGNDVFIGMNVIILDGVMIGDGAVIGAGAVVSKSIPPYAIAVGNPIKIIRYRFNEEQIQKLLEIQWWDFEKDKLFDVEKYLFDIDVFIQKYYKKK